MSEKVHQHVIPRVYLQYFASDNFVHIFEPGNPNRKNIQKKGIRHKIFTEENYYDWPGDGNQKHLENAFGAFESNYNEIVNRLESRSNIGKETKQLIVAWVHMMKMRSYFVRDTANTIFSQMGNAEKKAGKYFQLMSFSPDQYNKSLKDYSEDFMSKEWIVLYSTDLQFLTNDNPGLSITLKESNQRLNISPVFGDYNLSNEGLIQHIFPLTHYLCLCVRTPFDKQNESTDKDIQYQKAKTEMVDYINESVVLTRKNLIIANQPSDIERYLNRSNPV